MEIGLQMWPDLLDKARRGGLNVIQTYVFWNIHEPVEGQVRMKILEFDGFCVIKWIIWNRIDNLILLYLWNVQFNFEGNYDLVKFIKLIADKGMYVTLRVGPFIQAEWNHGYCCSSLPLSCFKISVTLFYFFFIYLLYFFFPSVSKMCFSV